MTRIKLATIATVLVVFSFVAGCYVSAPATATAKVQYKAFGLEELRHGSDAEAVQRVLDRASADGWEYAGSVLGFLIFKK